MGAVGELSGRVAIVTGASRGLGRAIALGLARAGAAVAIAARTESVWDERQPGTIFETVREIEALGGRAVAVATDVSKEEDLERLVATARRELGAVDILVNNAAVTIGGRPPDPGKSASVERSPSRDAVKWGRAPSIAEFPLKALKLHFAVNVFSAFRLMQLVVSDMVAKGFGSIINVSSDAAFRPGEGPYRRPGVPSFFAYGATKAALHNLTQAFAVEFADRGIAANVLLPSMPIPTPGAVSLMGAYNLKQWSTDESFAEAAVRLARTPSQERTGQILFHEDVNHPELGRRGFLSTEIEPS
jgi:NAD(P)-dependent dehydrogenase (short-subunit alcohol dehydrogenase family)